MGIAIRPTIIKSILLVVAVFAVVIMDSQSSSAASVTAALDSTSPKAGNSAPDGIFHHRIRYNQLGQHNDVKLDVYMDANTRKDIRINKVDCDTNLLGGVPNNTNIVRVTMVGATSPPPFNISAANLCDVSASGLFRNYTLPLPRYNGALQKYFVSVTIEYINPSGYLDRNNTATDRNAIGFTVNVINSSTSKIAPVSTNSRNYSVLANSTGGNSDFRIPFALPCGTAADGNPKGIRIYDADVTDLFGQIEVQVFKKGTDEAVPLSRNAETIGTIVNGNKFVAGPGAGNRENTGFDFVPATGQKYVLKISNLYNGNTIDIGMPNGMDTIYGAVTCPLPGQEVPTPVAYASITPVAAISQSDIEPGEQTTGLGYAAVENFPDLSSRDWPYQVQAVQDASNQGIIATQSNYDAREDYDATESGKVEFFALCANNTDYEKDVANCRGLGTPARAGNWRCNDGGMSNNSCGNKGGRAWNCKYTAPSGTIKQNPVPNGPDDGSRPGCNIFAYVCKNSSGNYSATETQFYDFNGQGANQCNNRWDCPNPSSVQVFSNSNPNANCKLFRCAVWQDVGWAAPNNYMFEDNNIGAAAQKCNFRCPANPSGAIGPGNYNGGGGYALLAQAGGDGKWGAGDLNCYYAPTFTIVCNIFDGSNTTTVSETVTGNGSWCSRNLVVQGPPNIGGQVCVTTSVTSPPNGAGWAGPGAANNQPWTFSVGTPDSDCVTVVSKPTFKVFGGDVSAGATFASNTCTNDFTSSSIVSWSGSATGYNGSYTEFGAFSSGSVYGFASSKRQGNVPSGLTFANTSTSGEWFGGNYGPMPCITNHASLKPANAPVMGSLNASNPSGSYEYASPQINNPPTIAKRQQLILYRTGDLYINNSILYDRNGWTTLADIPALKVVVTGNIYIAPGVTELNGVFVAQPDSSGNGGQIFTCAGVSNGNSFNGCSQPLTVNGAFIAKRVVLGRSFGTQRQGSTAEVFRYLPELWLTKWPQAGSSNSIRYDSITNLAPIL